jgi:hypothetical protein
MRPYLGVACFVFRALNKAWREMKVSVSFAGKPIQTDVTIQIIP